MVNREVVETRLRKLRDYLKVLKKLKALSFKEIEKDDFLRAALERYLHLAIECLLDIGNHIISDRGFRRAGDYREIFLILGENKVIPKKFSERLAPMGAFRNILVHDYVELDFRKVYDLLQSHYSDFERFAKYISALL